MMGDAGIVRNAEWGPAPGCCGCVVGRVVEVESIGVRGRTRRPVLDFPTVGVIVAACAAPPRDLCGPHLTAHLPPGGVAPVVPQCEGWPGRGIGGCAPILGPAVGVHKAGIRPDGLVGHSPRI